MVICDIFGNQVVGIGLQDCQTEYRFIIQDLGRGSCTGSMYSYTDIRKCKVGLGEGGFEYVEVLYGLEIGDEVVISDMGRYRDKEVLSIR